MTQASDLTPLEEAIANWTVDRGEAARRILDEQRYGGLQEHDSTTFHPEPAETVNARHSISVSHHVPRRSSSLRQRLRHRFSTINPDPITTSNIRVHKTEPAREQRQTEP